jgi:type IV fimbrial biogenesis protein FimT
MQFRWQDFPMQNSPCRRKGISLLELLIGVAVVAILMRMASPAMSSVMDSVKLTSMSNTFLSALYLARSEAIKRNGRVVLCKSVSGVSCNPDGGWEQGWIVFRDANNNAILDSEEEVIRRESGWATDVSLIGNSPVAKYISYTPVGTTKLSSGAFQAGTITVCRKSSPSVEARQIIVSSTGRARIEKTTVSGCPE